MGAEAEYEPTEEMVAAGSAVMSRFREADYDMMAYSAFRAMVQIAALHAESRRDLLQFLQGQER